jgi:raffinose/stachyose/melibiose transport system permease protein
MKTGPIVIVKRNYLFARGWKSAAPIFLFLPGFLAYLLIAVGPSLATAVYSFTDATGIRGIAINWIGFDNYHEFLLRGAKSRDNIAALKRTVTFSFFVTIIQFGLGLLFAVLLNQGRKGTMLFRTLFFMPVILGVAIQGLIWKLFLLPRGGPVAQALDLVGTSSELLGGPPRSALAWVIVVQIWSNVGITMVIFLAGLQGIPDDLYEAATIDGASSWQRFRAITLPLLKPTTFFVLMTSVIGSFQVFTSVYVMTQGGPNRATDVVVYHIYQNAWEYLRMGYASAMSWVLFMVILVVTVLQFKLIGKETTYFS